MTGNYGFYIPEGVKPIGNEEYGFNKYTIRSKDNKIAALIENSIRGFKIVMVPVSKENK